MKIHIPAFGGIAPALDPRDLPEGGAVEAKNVEAFGGSLKPLKGLSSETDAKSKAMEGSLSKGSSTRSIDPITVRTIHRFGESLPSGSAFWMQWASDRVSVARSQIAGSGEEWTFWTGGGEVDQLRAISKTYPSAMTLRLDAPLAAPAVQTNSPARVTGRSLRITQEALASRFIRSPTNFALALYIDGVFLGFIFHNNFLPVRYTVNGRLFAGETNIAAGYPNAQWRPNFWNAPITTLAALKTAVDAKFSAFVSTAMEDGALVLTLKDATKQALRIVGGKIGDKAVAPMYVPDPGVTVAVPTIINGYTKDVLVTMMVETSDDAASVRLADVGVAETRAYVYTQVTKFSCGYDVESAPSPPVIVDVYPKYNALNLAPSTDVTGASAMRDVVVSGLSRSLSATDDRLGASHVRLYRSVAGEYLFVGETAGSTFTDTLSASELGEVLPSLTWDAAPANLQGLVNLPNGILAGFRAQDVYFSEPYRPHAWPVAYSLTLDYPIIALARLDTTLVVLTTGSPYFIQGSHPDSMVAVRAQYSAACSHARSVVQLAGAIYYASPDGLVKISPNGMDLVTASLMRPEQWRALYPPSMMRAYAHRGQYVAFIGAPSTGGFVYDPASQFFSDHTYSGVLAGYTDYRSGQLFLQVTVANSAALYRWADKAQTDAGKALSWRSKVYELPHQTGFSWMQVAANAYPNGMKVELWVDRVLVFWHTWVESGVLKSGGWVTFDHRPKTGEPPIDHRQPFRLPDTIYGREFSVRVSGFVRDATKHPEATLLWITIAQSATELRQT